MIAHSQEVVTNLIFFGLGCVLGLVLGWTLKTMRYAKQARDAARTLTDIIIEERGEDGWYRHRISLLVVLFLTAGAAIATGIVNNNLRDSQQCTEKTFSRVIHILNDRTSLTSDVNKADVQANEAFSALFRGLLRVPPLPKRDARTLFEDYATKLNTYNELRREQSDAEFPSQEDYQDCLKGQ